MSEREQEIRALLGDGAATDHLNEIEREIARDAYALGRADAPSEATMEQRLENDQVRRLERTGRCPTCGSDV